MRFYPQQITSLPPEWVAARVAEFLREDLPAGDITSEAIISSGQDLTAQIQAVESLVFAGAQVLPACLGDQCRVELKVEDGATVAAEEVIAIIRGPARQILARERVTLNLLQRLSGIATLTRRFVELAQPRGVLVLDTRKTTPGLRLFEKYAVTVGGGHNHRLDLSSGILIKDNHLRLAGGITSAVAAARQGNADGSVELEVEDREQLLEGLEAGADAFLLDNMTPTQVEGLVAVVREHPRGRKIFLEASGGINLENFAAYARTGVDGISVGALTHSVRSMDLRLELVA